MKKTAMVLSFLLVSFPFAFINAQEEGFGEEFAEEFEPAERPEGFRGGGGPGMGAGPAMRREKMWDRMPLKMMNKREVYKKRIMEKGPFGEEKTLVIIKKHDPEFYDEIRELKAENPQNYFVIIKASLRLLRAAEMAKKTDLEKDVVEGIKLEYETRRLAGEYKEASSSEKGKIRERINDKFSRLFDLREKGNKVKIEMMEKHIKEMKERLADRKEHKNEIVKRRVDELLGKKFRW